MPDVTIDVEVYCARCGAGLCNQTESTFTRTRQQPSFRVEPCEKCLEAAREEGYDAGLDAGQAEEREE